MRNSIVAAAFSLVAGAAFAQAPPPAPVATPAPLARATGTFVDREGKEIGTLTMVEAARGVVVNVSIREGGLAPGRKGIHIHSVGTCADAAAGFVASGPHLGAPGLPHGFLNPTGDYGDLPNVIVHRDGSAEAEMFTNFASLVGAAGRGTMLDADGAAVVIHQNADDHATQPIGGAGPRLACAVVQRAN
jgi:Cu-Zn family superoxide dismutase